MRAYVTSIGEKTTDICVWQLQRLGFLVTILSGKEELKDKYEHFINYAQGDCLRVDADVIVNKNIEICKIAHKSDYKMIQYSIFDFYKNDISIGNPVWYSAEALQIIRDNFDKLDLRRPETSAWRLSQINPYTLTSDIICGMHGFFQRDKEIKRAKQNKIDRKQIELYDFELVKELVKLEKG